MLPKCLILICARCITLFYDTTLETAQGEVGGEQLAALKALLGSVKTDWVLGRPHVRNRVATHLSTVGAPH